MPEEKDNDKEKGKSRKNKLRTAGTGARMRRNKPPGPSKQSKFFIVFVGVLVLLAAIAAIILVLQRRDDFEISSEQFSGDIQVQGDDTGMVEWSNDFNDLNSVKAKALVENVKSKLKGALEDEGVSVDKVEVTSLRQAPPVSFVRKEQEGATGRAFKDVEYTGVSFVNVNYKTYGTPAKNAATFGSAKNDTWEKVGKMIKTRMASAGLQTEIKTLQPKASFTASVEKAVAGHAYDITTVKPIERDSVACDCQTTGFGKVTKENPSIICNCYEGCATGLPRTIIGGVEDTFSIKTAICPAARYADLITDDGGYVEVVFSGYQTVKNGPDKELTGFTMGTSDVYIHSVTLKVLGSVIKPTLPPTTADPKIGGFFRVETTTPNPYVKHDPGRRFVAAVANPPITMAIHLMRSGGKNLDYSALTDFSVDNPAQQEMAVNTLQDVMRTIQTELEEKIQSLDLKVLKPEVLNFDPPPDGETQGLVVRVSFVGENAEALEAVVATEAAHADQTLLQLLSSSYSSIGVVYSARYSSELLGSLRLRDKSSSARNIARRSVSMKETIPGSVDARGMRMASGPEGFFNTG